MNYKTYKPNNQTVEYDIAVLGGGLSGVNAAIAAAREGKKTILVEKYGFFGGMATAGLVNPFMSYCAHQTDEMINVGLFGEMLRRMYKKGGTNIPQCYHFNEQILKIVLDEMVNESGAHTLFHGLMTGVETSGDTVVSVVCNTISGMVKIKAKRFIDATGDAHLAAFAGVPFECGDDEGGPCQPMTTSFNLADVDYAKFNKKAANALYAEYKAAGKITNPRENILTFSLPSKNLMHFNSTRISGKDPLDAKERTEAEFIGRKQVWELYSFLKKNIEGMENAYLVAISDEIGVRESRRIKALYRLNEDDVLSCRKFDDGICCCSYDIDIHNQKEGGRCVKLPPKEYYTIPYRSLVPEGYDNLLVAGRSIGSSHVAQSSFRIMPVTACMGEAAGIAASVSIDKNTKMRNTNITEVHTILDKNGCRYK